MASPMISARSIGDLPGLIATAGNVRMISSAFEASEIPEEVSGAIDRYIPQRGLLRLLEQSARIVGEAEFGLLLGPHVHIADWGIWGSYPLAAPTILGAMQRAERALKYHVSHDRIFPSANGHEVAFRYDSMVSGVIGYRHYAITAACLMINLVQSYLGPGWSPKRVELDIGRPKSSTPHEDVFRCPVIFDQPSIAIIIDREEMARAPRRTATGKLVSFADLRRLVESGAPKDLVSSVNELVRLRLYDGDLNIETIAGDLNVGPRTLQRRLSDEGVAFRNIVSRVRAERAIELLRDDDIPMIDIAVELGYSTASHFTRAFRKTVGQVPSHFRPNAEDAAYAPTIAGE